MGAAAESHHFLGVTKEGTVSITHTSGNPDCRVILRGSNKGPNYEKKDIDQARYELEKAGIHPAAEIIIDCSHGNSSKDHRNQPKVSKYVADLVANGTSGISGLMIESNIYEGNQCIPDDNDLSKLKYGVSITDACVSFETTVDMLNELVEAVKSRRAKRNAQQ